MQVVKFKHKNKITEATEEPANLADLNVQQASTDEIAQAAQDSLAAETENSATISDQTADKIATEIKQNAQDVGAETAVILPSAEDEKEFETVNIMTEALDEALQKSRKFMRRGLKNGANILIEGLPGSGKTAIFYAWAESRGLNAFYLDAKNPDLETVINGMPVRDLTDKERNSLAMAYTKTLAPLTRPNSILFLDELNRQVKTHIRASLLTLINEKNIAGNNDTGRTDFGDTLLFTVACINPSVETDVGAAKLNTAEKSRFIRHLQFDSDVETMVDYLQKERNKQLLRLGVIVPGTKVADKYKKVGAYKDIDAQTNEDINDELRIADLGTFIVTSTSPMFVWDTRDDLQEIDENDYNLLNQRILVDALRNYDGDAEQLDAWVDKFSKLRPEAKNMLHDIISKYTVDIDELRKDVGLDSNAVYKPADNKTDISGDDLEDTDSDLDIEDDEDIFKQPSGANTKASDNAIDAKAKISKFADSL